MIQERHFKIHIDHLDLYIMYGIPCKANTTRFTIMVFASFRFTATIKVALLLQTH